MKSNDFMKFSLDAVLVEDPNIGGYTAYFKQFPDIIAEGDSEDVAIHHLLCALHDVFKYKSESKKDKIESHYKVIEKSVAFCQAPCV